jgi:hypothetical protein
MGRRGRDGTELDETTEQEYDRHNWRPHERTGPRKGYLGEENDLPMYCTGCRPHLRQLVRRGFDLTDA